MSSSASCYVTATAYHEVAENEARRHGRGSVSVVYACSQQLFERQDMEHSEDDSAAKAARALCARIARDARCCAYCLMLHQDVS